MNWNDWSKAVFVKAKKEKKPILLCISAVWCHWCHTMDRLVYADEAIAEFIEQNFVAIKVDTDKRPDINDRYNVGGWPSTVILAHNGEPVFGATYVPKQKMIDFLNEGVKRFSAYKKAKQKKTKLQNITFDLSICDQVIKSFYDPVNGGFGLEPKFPSEHMIEYLIYRAQKGDRMAAQMVETTLLKMAQSELFDSVEGGFFRYAEQQNWTFPHFEKLRESNAKLLGLYARAYRLFKRDEFLTVINKTLFWLVGLMRTPTGLFYASQDSDESYCKLNFESRLNAQHPFIDTTIYTAANAAAVLALFEVAELDEGYRDIALKALNETYKVSMHGLIAHVNPAETPLYLLRDHVYLLGALVHAFNLTGKLEYRAKALSVAKALDAFRDKKQGAFYDVLKAKDSAGRLKDRKKPVYENAYLARVFIELARVSDEKKFAVWAHAALKAVESDAVLQGPFAATFAIAYAELHK